MGQWDKGTNKQSYVEGCVGFSICLSRGKENKSSPVWSVYKNVL